MVSCLIWYLVGNIAMRGGGGQVGGGGPRQTGKRSVRMVLCQMFKRHALTPAMAMKASLQFFAADKAHPHHSWGGLLK